MQIEKVYLRYLLNITFKIVGSVLKAEKEEKCILNTNLKKTSGDILFSLEIANFFDTRVL